MLFNTLRLDLCYLEIIHVLHPPYHPKIIGHILKNKQKNKCVSIHEIIRLSIMKMKMKMKNRSHRHDINIPRLRDGDKNSKYRKCIVTMPYPYDTTLFLSNTSLSKARLKLAKNQANAKQHPETGHLLFETYLYSSSTLN